MIQNPILSIAGFDNSGGAGLQADLKVFSSFKCYGMTVITAIAVQNTTGVKTCHIIPLEIIEQQLETIFGDIPPKAIKIGMLFNSEIIQLVSDFLEKNAQDIPIIVDPVMIAKSGNSLLLPEAIDSLITKLIPLATIITPNLPEALTLIKKDSSFTISPEEIGQELLVLGAQYVLLKGGHYQETESCDYLVSKKENQKFCHNRINTKNTHGTGCTLSAAITAGIARGYSITHSVFYAKKYLTNALLSASNYSVGKGYGPTDHLWFLDEPCNGKIYD